MIHVVPPMGPPNFIKESEISDHQGWVDISPYTLQHVQYKNIFDLEIVPIYLPLKLEQQFENKYPS